MRKWHLRFWLAILSVLLICNPAWTALTNMQLTIVNNSGYPDSQVYIAYLLQPGYDHVNWYHISNWQTIAIQEFSTADNTVEVPKGSGNKYAVYSTTLDKLNKNAAGRRYFEMPPCNAGSPSVPTGIETGRLWVSFGKPVYFKIISSAEFSQPNPNNPSDVNNDTVWDFFEAKTTPGSTLFRAYADTTNVDYTVMPMVYELYNDTTQVGKMGLDRSRKQLYNALASDPLLRPLMSHYRMMAPGHGQSDPAKQYYFPANYFDPYVTYCWTHWTSNTLTFDYPKNVTTWTGTVNADNGMLTLTSGGGEVHHIAKPNSQEVFLCNGVFNGSGEQWSNLLQVYNPSGGTWTNGTVLPAYRSGMAAGVIGGKLYVAGGKTPDSGVVVPCHPVNVVQEYDPVLNAWTTKTHMPTTRQDAGAAVIGGKLYVVGGQTQDNGGWSNVLEVYDPVADSWATKAAMPTARRGLAVAALDGKLYAMGGEGATGVLDTVEIYDPALDKWETSTDLTLQLKLVGAMAVADGGKIYLAGGLNDQYKGTGNLWSTTGTSWTTLTPMPKGVGFSQAVIIDGKLYIPGGYTEFGQPTSTRLLVYTVSSNNWLSETGSPLVPTPAYAFAAGALDNKLHIAGGVAWNTARFTSDAALKNQIASALNRSVMHLPPYPTTTKTEYPWGGYTAHYYVNTATPVVPGASFKTNLYSHILHTQAIDQKIYGFAYDDNNRQASYVEGDGTEIRLTINNCILGDTNYLLLLLSH
jgi:N-acetylneuraminic acid mutarotase